MEEKNETPRSNNAHEEIARLLQHYTFHPYKKRKLEPSKPQDEQIVTDRSQLHVETLAPDDSFTEEVLDSSSVPVVVPKIATPQQDVTITRPKRKRKQDPEDEGEILEMADILVNITSVKDEKQSAKGGDSEEAHKKAKRKKRRARTSPDQLELLENIFKTDQMPDQQMRVRLADRLGMTPRRVQIWFQNKRAKLKKAMQQQANNSQYPRRQESFPESILSTRSNSSSSSLGTVEPTGVFVDNGENSLRSSDEDEEEEERSTPERDTQDKSLQHQKIFFGLPATTNLATSASTLSLPAIIPPYPPSPSHTGQTHTNQNSSLPSLSTSATTNGIPKLVSGATSSKASANGAHKPFAIPLNGKASSSSNFSSGISFGNGASNGSSVFFPPGITKSSNGTSTYPSSFMQTGLKIYPTTGILPSALLSAGSGQRPIQPLPRPKKLPLPKNSGMNSTFATPSGPDWLVASGPLPAIPITAGGSGWGSGSMKFNMPHTPSLAPRPLLPATRGSEATIIASSKIKTSETTTTTLSIFPPIKKES